MKLKTFFSTILLLAVISLSVIIFSFTNKANAENKENKTKLYETSLVDNCDPSQYTYVKVIIDGVSWIFVYNCDGVLIDEYPTN